VIYFIYGLDTFRVNHRVSALRQGLMQNQPNLDYSCLIAPKFTWAEFCDALQAQSLLAQDKLIVVENLLSLGKKDLQEKIANHLSSDIAKDVVLVFLEHKDPDKRTKLFKTLNKFITEQYGLLKPHQARGWLKEKASELKLNLSSEAANLLLSDFSSDLWRLNNELEKLSNYNQDKIVDKDVLKLLVPQSVNDNIFQTIDALAKKDIKLANKLIISQLHLGTTEQQLLAMIAYQFRNIALIKSLTDKGIANSNLAKASGLHPYVAQKTIGFSTNFSKPQLVKAFWLINKVDTAIKTGQTPPSAGLDILLAQIAKA